MAMTQRPEPRLDSDFPIRVWGMDSNGKPFIQHVRVKNISNQGALVSGVECELKPGEIIGVQVEQKKARCRIVWWWMPVAPTRMGCSLWKGKSVHGRKL